VFLRCRSRQHDRWRPGRATRPGWWPSGALSVLLAGCVRAASSVDPRPAPAFELQVLDSRPCPTAADPQLACFTVEIRNGGNKVGNGSCVVHHYSRAGELVGEGPSFRAHLAPNGVARQQGQAHLAAPFTTLRLNSAYCYPGSRL
jgi:hypothetical protein